VKPDWTTSSVPAVIIWVWLCYQTSTANWSQSGNKFAVLCRALYCM